MNIKHHHVEINAIRLHYVEAGRGTPVVLCHGFPHLWYSWNRQIPALVEAGCRVIVPDMRGMGETSAPQDVHAYGIHDICGDLLGLLDHAGADRAIFCGLDFGAFAAYDLAHLHADRMLAVIGLQNPAAPHNPEMPPLAEYREQGKDHFLHINYFVEEPGRADADMAARVELFFHKVLWTLSGEGNYFDCFKHAVDTHYIDAMNDAPPLPWPWFSDDDMQVYVDAYKKTGFTGGLNYYRAMDLKWRQRKPLENHVSTVPAYFIGSDADVDLEGFHGEDPISLMRRQFLDLRCIKMLPKCGHLMQLEAHREVNAVLVEFIDDIRKKA